MKIQKLSETVFNNVKRFIIFISSNINLYIRYLVNNLNRQRGFLCSLFIVFLCYYRGKRSINYQIIFHGNYYIKDR